MNKHTPKPWRVDRNGVVTGGKDFCTSIAECYLPPKLKTRPGHKDLARILEEQKANADLIMAAPEILDALKAFMRAPSVGSDGPGSSTIVVQDFNRRAAREAIAKAEGKA
jgi:hypothetical protein